MSLNTIEMSLEGNSLSNSKHIEEIANDSIISDQIHEKVIWPGLNSLYLGLSLRRNGL